MKERFISAALYAIVVLSAIILGGKYFVAIIGLMGLICAYEYARMMKIKGHTDNTVFIMGGVIFMLLGMGVYDYIYQFPYMVLLPLPFIMFREMRKESGSIVSGFLAFSGIVYLGFGFGALLELQAYSKLICFLAFLITCSTDTGAFFVGCAVGKHKLCPRVSPKKSVEGAIGGVLICVAFCLTYNHFLLEISLLPILLIGVLCSIMGQLGDLCESFVKRYAGVKDSGTIMPGHGGLFDRMDSMMMVAPILLCILGIF